MKRLLCIFIVLLVGCQSTRSVGLVVEIPNLQRPVENLTFRITIPDQGGEIRR